MFSSFKKKFLLVNIFFLVSKILYIIFIDDIYDSHIRSETLIELLNKKILESKNKIRKQNPSEGETYYIIHPVLKHIAILSCTI